MLSKRQEKYKGKRLPEWYL